MQEYKLKEVVDSIMDGGDSLIEGPLTETSCQEENTLICVMERGGDASSKGKGKMKCTHQISKTADGEMWNER